MSNGGESAKSVERREYSRPSKQKAHPHTLKRQKHKIKFFIFRLNNKHTLKKESITFFTTLCSTNTCDNLLRVYKRQGHLLQGKTKKNDEFVSWRRAKNKVHWNNYSTPPGRYIFFFAGGAPTPTGPCFVLFIGNRRHLAVRPCVICTRIR